MAHMMVERENVQALFKTTSAFHKDFVILYHYDTVSVIHYASNVE